jgi:hypothetical protein
LQRLGGRKNGQQERLEGASTHLRAPELLAQTSDVRSRDGAEEGGQENANLNLRDLLLVSGTARVSERPFTRLDCRPVPARDLVDVTNRHPRRGQVSMVAEFTEQADRLLGRSKQLAAPTFGIGQAEETQPVKTGAGFDAAIGGCCGGVDRLDQHGVGAGEFAGLAEGRPELDEKLAPCKVCRRQ